MLTGLLCFNFNIKFTSYWQRYILKTLLVTPALVGIKSHCVWLGVCKLVLFFYLSYISYLFSKLDYLFQARGIEVEDDVEIKESDIKKFLKQYLANYKIPKHIYFIEELPKNATGKVLKRVLREKIDEYIKN